MKIDWRITAIAAGSAFVLSFLIGVFGHVSFGILVLRALISAVVFGGGAIGVKFLADKFLPELQDGRENAEPVSSSGLVDIVVDGESEEKLAPESESGEEFVAGDGAERVEKVEPAGPAETLMDDEAGEVVGMDDDPASPVEELPNVDSMSDSFTEVPLAEAPAEDTTGSGEDPALMARAIRSVLKREE